VCQQCDCAEKRAKELDVPGLLEMVVDEFEGPDLSAREAMVRGLFAI